jgi:hypothetical protein
MDVADHPYYLHPSRDQLNRLDRFFGRVDDYFRRACV